MMYFTAAFIFHEVAGKYYDSLTDSRDVSASSIQWRE